MNIKRYVDIARALVPKVEKREKHFSFLLQGHKILSVGFNHPLFHPRAKSFGYKYGDYHSELACLIRNAETDCSGLSMVNVRMNRFGEVGNSKPCPICQKVLKMFKIKKVYFTLDNLGNNGKIKI